MSRTADLEPGFLSNSSRHRVTTLSPLELGPMPPSRAIRLETGGSLYSTRGFSHGHSVQALCALRSGLTIHTRFAAAASGLESAVTRIEPSAVLDAIPARLYQSRNLEEAIHSQRYEVTWRPPETEFISISTRILTVSDAHLEALDLETPSME